MRSSRIEFSVQLASFVAIVALTFTPTQSFAQLKGVSAPLQRSIATLSDQVEEQAKPYVLSSRFHLMEGTTSGYLVVQVELGPGNHLYSLNQAGAISPTKIEVVPNDAFYVDGKFNPDRPAEVVENDPVFNQRVEKHKGKVQFFVPVKFNSTDAINNAQPEVVLNGQVCSQDGVCMAIRDKKVTAEFGGFFGRTVEAPGKADKPTLR